MRTFVFTQHGTHAKTRKSRESILQCWCSRKVSTRKRNLFDASRLLITLGKLASRSKTKACAMSMAWNPSPASSHLPKSPLHGAACRVGLVVHFRGQNPWTYKKVCLAGEQAHSRCHWVAHGWTDRDGRFHARSSHIHQVGPERKNPSATTKSAFAHENLTGIFSTSALVHGTSAPTNQPFFEPFSVCIPPCCKPTLRV